MERLWAPWRMHYIGSIPDADGCFLCHIQKSDKDAENLVIARRPHCFVVLNRYPYNNGHTLVCPNDHAASLDQISEPALADLMRTTGRLMNIQKKLMRPDGFNVGLNFGRVAGAGLPDHLHMHIVPRWSGDTNFMPVLADVKVIPQALEELHEKLVAAWKEQNYVE